MTCLIMFRWMKKQQEYKNNEHHTFTIKISMRIVIATDYNNNF